MKKQLLVAGLMMVSTIIFAQRHYRGNHTGTGRADRMKKELSLNDDQYGKLKTIDKTFAERWTKLRADTAITVGSARNQMKHLREEHQEEVKGVLTADQWTKW